MDLCQVIFLINGNLEQLFDVIDEMEARGIQVDMGTWQVLEEVFTVGMRRPNDKRGDIQAR